MALNFINDKRTQPRFITDHNIKKIPAPVPKPIVETNAEMKARKDKKGGDPFTSIWNTLVGRPKPSPVLTIRKPVGGRSKKRKTHRRRR